MTKRFMVRLPDKVLESIDDLIEIGLFTDRQDFLKEASRRYLEHLHSEHNNIMRELTASSEL